MSTVAELSTVVHVLMVGVVWEASRAAVVSLVVRASGPRRWSISAVVWARASSMSSRSPVIAVMSSRVAGVWLLVRWRYWAQSALAYAEKLCPLKEMVESRKWTMARVRGVRTRL